MIQVGVPTLGDLKYNDPSSVTMRKTKYFHINEGQGATVTINAQGPTHVGTSGLRMCVGVYLPISASRCFIAHIFACVKTDTDHKKTFHFKESEKQALRQVVKSKLSQHARSNGWTAQDVVSATRSGKEPIVMCPLRSLPGDAADRPGQSIVKAIYDFLEEPAGLLREEFDTFEEQGFVVDHHSGAFEKIVLSWPGKPGVGTPIRDLNPGAKYDVHVIVAGRDEWHFEIEPEE